MVAGVLLAGKGATLKVETFLDGSHWCRCSLYGGHSVYLGAEAATVVLAKLKNAVAEDLPGNAPSGEIDGLPVQWVLSLAEAHWSLYAAQAGSERMLFWDNGSDPRQIIKVCLSIEEQRQWRKNMETFQAKLNRISFPRNPAVHIKEIAETVGGPRHCSKPFQPGCRSRRGSH